MVKRLAEVQHTFTAPTGEPTKTIFQERWHSARLRSRLLTRRERELFAPLLDTVEDAWPYVRALQHLHDQLRPTATGTFARVLDFIDDHVCDRFREVAGEVAVFVPVPGGGMTGEPNFDDADGDADQFGAYVAILRAACFDPDVPPSTAALVRQSTEPLLTWYRDFEPVLKRAADAVQGP